MKVLLVNGSPNAHGCTYTALSEVASALNSEEIQTEIYQIGKGPVQGCIACGYCGSAKECTFKNDVVSNAAEKIREADGFVFGSPVYCAGATGQITSFLNRLNYSNKRGFLHKPGAAIVSCRRAGSTATLDQLNKYLVICQMLLVGSQSWAMVHGTNPDEVRRDLEGMQTMRLLGRNMAWILKSIEAGREAGIQLPKPEERIYSKFSYE